MEETQKAKEKCEIEKRRDREKAKRKKLRRRGIEGRKKAQKKGKEKRVIVGKEDREGNEEGNTKGRGEDREIVAWTKERTSIKSSLWRNKISGLIIAQNNTLLFHQQSILTTPELCLR